LALLERGQARAEGVSAWRLRPIEIAGISSFRS
jgi:hypothetical protein